ncbi:MAG: zf-HC2 domain-containing protein, partial [Spirochaetaceae bacterium]|nr:zf-HC2 domain-containing protein [Spirochaetaceae bacterium]
MARLTAGPDAAGMVDMCPDSQILSVYFDGELPDPWRTRLESHLASCAACREKRARWERHRNAIRPGEDADMEAARNRVWENLSASHGRAHGRIKPARRAAPAFWRRSVAIPLPAAAAAAVAIVALAFALFRAQNGNAGSRGIEPQMAAGMSLDAREVVPVS